MRKVVESKYRAEMDGWCSTLEGRPPGERFVKGIRWSGMNFQNSLTSH